MVLTLIITQLPAAGFDCGDNDNFAYYERNILQLTMPESVLFITEILVHLLQVTKGLWKKWGDKRVKDTPITEVIHHVKCFITLQRYICHVLRHLLHSPSMSITSC